MTELELEKLFERLDKVVGIYGGDMSRWPYDDLLALKDFVRADVRAQLRLEEGVALDRVLADAPLGNASSDLVGKILSEAAGDSATEDTTEDTADNTDVSGSPDGDVEDVAGGSAVPHVDVGEADSVSDPVAVSPEAVATVRLMGFVGGGLAVCLAVGLYLGLTGVTSGVFESTFELAGLVGTTNSESDVELFSLLPSSSFEEGVVPSEEFL